MVVLQLTSHNSLSPILNLISRWHRSAQQETKLTQIITAYVVLEGFVLRFYIFENIKSKSPVEKYASRDEEEKMKDVQSIGVQ